jgi:hypothetical protein
MNGVDVKSRGVGSDFVGRHRDIGLMTGTIIG